MKVQTRQKKADKGKSDLRQCKGIISRVVSLRIRPCLVTSWGNYRREGKEGG